MAETTRLPPYSEMETTTLTTRTLTDGTWLVENKTNKQNPVVVARSITTLTGKEIPVRLLNYVTSNAIDVHAGTQIATMASVRPPQEVTTIASAETDVTETKCEMLEYIVRHAEEHLTNAQGERLFGLLSCYSNILLSLRGTLGIPVVFNTGYLQERLHQFANKSAGFHPL